jgi:asparagine synthase (glutamine-hydrolysing)
MGSLVAVLHHTSRPDAEVATTMLRAAPHRGPELDVRVCGRAVLGVSNDPEFRDSCIAAHNGLTLAFAGVLDNRAELDAELRRAGVTVRGDNAANTALAALRTWGETAPNRFRGMFTGAVTDGAGLRCFRDHLGFRPLFYRNDARAFFAATEAKQVIAGAGIRREPDMDGLAAILVAGKRTNALLGLERFPSSSVASVNGDGRVAFRRFWEPERLVEGLRLSVSDACERLGELLEQAIRRVVIGGDAISLSGGIDSPSIAGFAAPRHRQLTGRPLKAVSAVFPHLPSVDERRYIELISEYLGIELHTYVPQRGTLDDLDFWVRLLDAPVDTISMPALEENYGLARRLGARSVLSGELGEYVYAMHPHLLGHLIVHGRWRAAGRRVIAAKRRGSSVRGIARRTALSVAPPFLATRWARFRNLDYRFIPPWLDAGSDESGRPDLAWPARRRWSELQVGPTGRGGTSPTLEADEICAAYCGVHVRRPLTDVDLWEFFLGLRAETKYPTRHGKYLVRRTMHGRVPSEILQREDKTLFDDYARATVDYPTLRRWILGTDDRLDGVDYALLRSRLEREQLELGELRVARDLARIHAFLETFA